MQKIKFTISIILIFFTFSYAFSKSEEIGILATVNGQPITLGDVLELTYNQESQLPLIYRGKELNDEIMKNRKKALEIIIDRKLAYMEFKDNGYKLPKEFVESNMDMLMKTFNVSTRLELEQVLRDHGATMTEFKEKAYESLAVDALIYGRCYSEVFITPKTVEEYYKKHLSEFTTPASVKLSVITLNKNGVHKTDAEPLATSLSSSLKGKSLDDFNEAVGTYSDGPNLKGYGDIGFVAIPELRKEFADAIKEYKAGFVSDPIETKDAFYVIRVTDYKKEHSLTYSEAKGEIRDNLTLEAKKKNYQDYMKKLRKSANIIYFI